FALDCGLWRFATCRIRGREFAHYHRRCAAPAARLTRRRWRGTEDPHSVQLASADERPGRDSQPAVVGRLASLPDRRRLGGTVLWHSPKSCRVDRRGWIAGRSMRPWGRDFRAVGGAPRIAMLRMGQYLNGIR